MAERAQKKIDFVRGTQLSSLRSLTERVELAVGKVLRTVNDTGVSLATAMLLLRQIDDHAGKQGVCTASAYTLAKEIGRCKRTVQRALEVLDSQGLIVQVEQAVKTKVNRVVQVRRRVCWPNVLEEEIEGTPPESPELSLGRGEIPPTAAGHNPAGDGCHNPAREQRSSRGQRGRVTRDFSAEGRVTWNGGQGDMVSRQGDMVSLDPYISSAKESPPPPSPCWASLHLQLVDLGAEFPGDALQLARRAGVPSVEVQSRIDYWRAESPRQGWKVGSLVFSISQSVPGLAVDRGWPQRRIKPPKPAGPGQVAPAAINRESKSDRHARYVQLELQFGSTIDRVEWSQPAQLWAVLEQAGESYVQTARLLKQGLRAMPIRMQLLKAAERGQIT